MTPRTVLPLLVVLLAVPSKADDTSAGTTDVATTAAHAIFPSDCVSPCQAGFCDCLISVCPGDHLSCTTVLGQCSCLVPIETGLPPSSVHATTGEDDVKPDLTTGNHEPEPDLTTGNREPEPDLTTGVPAPELTTGEQQEAQTTVSKSTGVGVQSTGIRSTGHQSTGVKTTEVHTTSVKTTEVQTTDRKTTGVKTTGVHLLTTAPVQKQTTGSTGNGPNPDNNPDDDDDDTEGPDHGDDDYIDETTEQPGKTSETPQTSASSTSGSSGGSTSTTGTTGTTGPDGEGKGDPHFRGFDGNKYSFQGEPDKVFAIISEPHLQLNSLFKKAIGSSGVEMRKTCINYCGKTILFDGVNQTVVVDGIPLNSPGKTVYKNITIITEKKGIVHREVSTLASLGKRWLFQIRMVHNRVDILHAWPNMDRDVPMHGVLGHTWNLPKNKEAKCNIYSEGGCEVSGEFPDYEVDELCSPEWKYSQWTGEGCD